MNQVITGQIEFVVATMCNGMLLIAGYDVLRLFRWFIPHSRIAVAVEDILYWLLASIPTFCLFFFYNEGIIRWYGLLGLLAGSVLYETGISKPIRKSLGYYGGRFRRFLGNSFPGRMLRRQKQQSKQWYQTKKRVRREQRERQYQKRQQEKERRQEQQKAEKLRQKQQREEQRKEKKQQKKNK